MKIRYAENAKPKVDKLGRDIEIGIVFSGSIVGESESIFTKTCDRILRLSDYSSWYLSEDDPHGIDHIDNYKELDVELLVKGEK